MDNTHAELRVSPSGWFILDCARDYQSCNSKIQITEDQLERLDAIRIQLNIFLIVVDSELLNGKLEISFSVVTTIIARCEKLERYDLLAEAMQLFHEMGVDMQDEELL